MDTNSVQNLSQNKTLNTGMPPKTWLVESILATILCCLPLGVVGIIYATKVESKFYAGDVEGAMRDSQTAKKWTIAAAISAIVVWILYILFIVGIFAWGVSQERWD